MKSIVGGAMAGAALAAALAMPSPSEASGQNAFTQPIWARVYSITPQCRANPDYPVVGRVAGYVAGSARARLSWVGCFPNVAECEAWRRIARGQIVPPIVQNVCESRF